MYRIESGVSSCLQWLEPTALSFAGCGGTEAGAELIYDVSVSCRDPAKREIGSDRQIKCAKCSMRSQYNEGRHPPPGQARDESYIRARSRQGAWSAWSSSKQGARWRSVGACTSYVRAAITTEAN